MTSTNSGSSLPVRQANSRHHSHSMSAGSFNTSHRVTRRRSVSSNTANNAVVIAAAAREVGGGAVSAMSVSLSSRRNTMSKTAGAKVGSLSNYPITPSSFPSHRNTTPSSSRKPSESAVEDDSNENDDEFEESGPNPAFGNLGRRRASEGQALIKGDGKKSHAAELKCDKCGKGYKHSSCLTKHRWEHTPEWSLTSKLLISKHQQVQLLEAASVLVGMNIDNTPPLSAKDFQSDQEESSASPAASGYSDMRDSRDSSAYTTPPPQAEGQDDHANRYSSGSGFSRSYQSAPSTHSAFSSSMPSSYGFSHYQQGSERSVISPSLTAISTGNKEEDESLANAIGVLSCGFGTPQSRVTTMPVDVPPVPPLPPQYASYAQQYTAPSQHGFSGSTEAPISSSYQPWGADSYAASERYHISDDRSQADVKMEDGVDSPMDEDDDEQRYRGRSDEDDEGVFGRMEE